MDTEQTTTQTDKPGEINSVQSTTKVEPNHHKTTELPVNQAYIWLKKSMTTSLNDETLKEIHTLLNEYNNTTIGNISQLVKWLLSKANENIEKEELIQELRDDIYAIDIQAKEYLFRISEFEEKIKILETPPPAPTVTSAQLNKETPKKQSMTYLEMLGL